MNYLSLSVGTMRADTAALPALNKYLPMELMNEFARPGTYSPGGSAFAKDNKCLGEWCDSPRGPGGHPQNTAWTKSVTLITISDHFLKQVPRTGTSKDMNVVSIMIHTLVPFKFLSVTLPGWLS